MAFVICRCIDPNTQQTLSETLPAKLLEGNNDLPLLSHASRIQWA